MAEKSKNKVGLTIALAVVAVIALGYAFMGSGKTTAVSVNTEKSAPAEAKAAGSAAAADTQEMPMAPDFTLRDLENKSVKLSDYRGKVVFVNFWATWCPPCRREIPAFIDLVNKYGKDGFVVLGIAVDSREFEKVPGFVEQMGMNYPVLYDETGVSNLYGGIRSIPTTFVINREGRVAYRVVGSRPKDVFEQVVTSLL